MLAAAKKPAEQKMMAPSCSLLWQPPVWKQGWLAAVAATLPSQDPEEILTKNNYNMSTFTPLIFHAEEI